MEQCELCFRYFLSRVIFNWICDSVSTIYLGFNVALNTI